MLPRKVVIDRDIEYLDPRRDEKLDIYYPVPECIDKRYPGIVVIHGGGWFTQSKVGKRETTIASSLAAEGFVCASIDYKLVDLDNPASAIEAWPTNVHDCKRAVRFLRENADRYRIDPHHIGAIGGSAGGHLSAMLACAGPEAHLDPLGSGSAEYNRIQGAVYLYGVGDLHHWIENAETERKGMTALALMLGGTVYEIPEAYRSASPINYASSASAPLLLVHGREDDVIFYKESEHFARELAKRGAPHELVGVDGAVHSFYMELFEGDLRGNVLGFLSRTLRSKGEV